jgi:hypothetical protein
LKIDPSTTSGTAFDNDLLKALQIRVLLNGGDVIEMCVGEIVEAVSMPAPMKSKIFHRGVSLL